MDDLRLHLALLFGPDEDVASDVLERAWSVFGAEMLAREYPRPDRPWGWWRFEVREEMPATYQEQAVRLIELGELSGVEIGAVERVAREALEGIEASNRAEDASAIVTGPVGAASRMRARRVEDAAGWARVLEAVGAGGSVRAAR